MIKKYIIFAIADLIDAIFEFLEATFWPLSNFFNAYNFYNFILQFL